MRAVVIGTGQCSSMPILTERHPTPMLPLLDRPFIQHVVESLVDQGVTQFDFILGHLPEQVEALLGDGARWGSRFTFHLARDLERPYKLIRALDLSDGSATVLLGHADRLVQLDIAAIEPLAPHSDPVLFCWSASGGQEVAAKTPWTGWACMSAATAASLPVDGDEQALGQHLRDKALAAGRLADVAKPLSMCSYEDMLETNRRVLDREFTGPMFTGSEVEKGVWLSRNVSLHRTARLVPPVYIGENCRVGPGAQLGPYAAIGRDCVLDGHCMIDDSVVFSRSYVGEGLQLSRAIADKNRLVNVQLNADITVADDFILGSLSDKHVRLWLARRLSRLTAAVLFVLTLPVLFVTAVVLKLSRGGPVFHTREVVHLPASSDDVHWRTFPMWSMRPHGPRDDAHSAPWPGVSDLFLRFLPALLNIAKGDLHFVGVAPRTKDEVAALPADWRTLYLRSKAGVVTEANVNWGLNPDEDEQYAAEAFYSVSAGFRHDLSLLARYFIRILRGGHVTSRRDEVAT